MERRLLMEGRLDELLSEIGSVQDPEDGFYVLYAARGAVSLTEDMRCAIILSLHEDDGEFISDVAQERNLEPACIISDVQNVIEIAREDKPSANITDLIMALNYYLHNDAFIDFSQE